MASHSPRDLVFECCVCLNSLPALAQCLLACGHGPCHDCALKLLALAEGDADGLACPLCRRFTQPLCTLSVAVVSRTPSRLEELNGVSVYATREEVLARMHEIGVDALRVRDLVVRGSFRFRPHTTLLENHVCCCRHNAIVWVLLKATSETSAA